MDIEKVSDQELEDIIRRAQNTNVSGSQFQRASLELEMRRKRQLFEQQEKLLSSLQTRLDKIIYILTYINKKPLVAAVIAGVSAVTIGVAVNVISSWLQIKLGIGAK